MNDYTLTIAKFNFNVHDFIEAFSDILDDEDISVLISNENKK
jgi:hypothetical protein